MLPADFLADKTQQKGRRFDLEMLQGRKHIQHMQAEQDKEHPCRHADHALGVGREGDDRTKGAEQSADHRVGKGFAQTVQQVRTVGLMPPCRLLGGIADNQRAAHPHAVEASQEAD